MQARTTTSDCAMFMDLQFRPHFHLCIVDVNRQIRILLHILLSQYADGDFELPLHRHHLILLLRRHVHDGILNTRREYK
jgi:hypothetical protein